MSEPSGKYAISMVTDEFFVIPTIAALHSFFKHNHWFNGEIIILHDQLSQESIDILTFYFKGLRLVEINPELKKRVDEVVKVRENLAAKKASFYTIETCSLRDYDKVLYFDGDILFMDSIEELFTMEAPLVCSGEGIYYMNGCRDEKTLEGLYEINESETNVLRKTFNCGFLLFDRCLLTDENYRGLLDLIDPEKYKKINAKMTDQAVFNIFFAGKQSLVGAVYNFLWRYRDSIRQKEGVSFTEAKVLHFPGPAKPWKHREAIKATLADPAFVKAVDLWQKNYLEMLQKLRLKSVFPETGGTS